MSFIVRADRSYATAFPLTENPISESGLWLNGLTPGLDWANGRTVAGQYYGTQTGNGSDGLNQVPTKYDDSTSLVNGAAWGNNHQGDAVIFNNEIAGNWNSELEIRLRSTLAAHVNSGYEFNVRVKNGGPGYVEIIRWNGAIGDFTPLVHNQASDGTYLVVTGDAIRAKAVGSVLELWLRQSGVWTLRATYNTSTGNDGGTPGTPDSIIFTGGRPGLGHYLNNQGQTGDPSRFGFTSCAFMNL